MVGAVLQVLTHLSCGWGLQVLTHLSLCSEGTEPKEGKEGRSRRKSSSVSSSSARSDKYSAPDDEHNGFGNILKILGYDLQKGPLSYVWYESCDNISLLVLLKSHRLELRDTPRRENSAVPPSPLQDHQKCLFASQVMYSACKTTRNACSHPRSCIAHASKSRD